MGFLWEGWLSKPWKGIFISIDPFQHRRTVVTSLFLGIRYSKTDFGHMTLTKKETCTGTNTVRWVGCSHMMTMRNTVSSLEFDVRSEIFYPTEEVKVKYLYWNKTDKARHLSLSFSFLHQFSRNSKSQFFSTSFKSALWNVTKIPGDFNNDKWTRVEVSDGQCHQHPHIVLFNKYAISYVRWWCNS